jgi:hypothetical protein
MTRTLFPTDAELERAVEFIAGAARDHLLRDPDQRAEWTLAVERTAPWTRCPARDFTRFLAGVCREAGRC